MASQKDIKARISSVKNIQKITRAMEMVAAARLRRAEQRIEALRPYAGAIRRMTRQAAEAAGGEVGKLPILQQHESENTIAMLLVTADRGLAGAFNSQIIRAGVRAAAEYEGDGKQVTFYASGRRGVSSLTFRGRDVTSGYTGFTERPAYANAREIADDLITAYVDGEVDRVRARRADDRDAERVRERGGADRGTDPPGEPRPPGGNHSRNLGGRRGSGGARMTEKTSRPRRPHETVVAAKPHMFRGSSRAPRRLASEGDEWKPQPRSET